MEYNSNYINKINDINISDDLLNLNYYSNSISNLDTILYNNINTNTNTNLNTNLNTIFNDNMNNNMNNNMNIMQSNVALATPNQTLLATPNQTLLTDMNDEINLEILLNCDLSSIIEMSNTNTYYRNFITNNIKIILSNSKNNNVKNFINNNEEILFRAKTFTQIKLIHQINLDLMLRKRYRNLKEINRLIFMYSDETCEKFMLLMQKGFMDHQYWTYDIYDTIHLILMHNLVQQAIVLKELGFEQINHIYSIVKSNKLDIAIDLWNKGFRQNDLIAYMTVDVSERSRTYAILSKKRGSTDEEIQNQFISGTLTSNL